MFDVARRLTTSTAVRQKMDMRPLSTVVFGQIRYSLRQLNIPVVAVVIVVVACFLSSLLLLPSSSSVEFTLILAVKVVSLF